MSELITIQVGQCGNQIGSCFWPLILQEYGIQDVANGVTNSNTTNRKALFNLQDCFQNFFHVPEKSSNFSAFSNISELTTSNVKARALLIDMEDSVVERFKTGSLRDLFDEKYIISNYPGSGNNWAQGFCNHGPKYESSILNAIRDMMEKCDSLQGFLLLFSVGGGTGSGLGSYLVKLLSEYYPHMERIVTCVYPIGTEDVITCPYNMALSTQHMNESASCIFPVENRALIDIVNRQTRNRQFALTVNRCKHFQDMNTIIVNMLLNLTSGSRFSGSLNLDMNEISTNMVPFPKLNYLSSSFSPTTVCSDTLLKFSNKESVRDDLFANCIHRSNQLLKIDCIGRHSILLGAALLGRGDFAISDMRRYIEKLRNKAQFTQWSSKAVKVGVCKTPPPGYIATMLSIFNTSAMANLFQIVSQQFQALYNKKAHVHHYTDVTGFEEEHFKECFDNLMFTIDSYREIAKVKPMTVPRLVPR